MLSEGQIVRGSIFNEPMRVITVQPAGSDAWRFGMAVVQSDRFRQVTLTRSDIEALAILNNTATYQGDAELLRLGLQAYALGIAYEFGPYFGLSIWRVDPLPHQLAAVYDHLLRLARVRYLLTDDPGTGKTIMARLLIKELIACGDLQRCLIVCPGSLAEQWQDELDHRCGCRAFSLQTK